MSDRFNHPPPDITPGAAAELAARTKLENQTTELVHELTKLVVELTFYVKARRRNGR